MECESPDKLSTFSAGIDGSVAVGGGGDAGGAFLRGGIDRLQKNLKPKFFILFGHLREAGLIHREPLLPALLLKFFFSGHQILPFEVRGWRFKAKTLLPHTSNLTPQALI
jgi:hypothetical protein